MKDEKDPVDLLAEKTIERLEKYGWKQGDYGSRGNPQCLVGAVEAMRRHKDEIGDYEVKKYKKLYLRLLALIGIENTGNYKDLVNKVITWNDNLYRKKEEVIDLLRRSTQAK